MIAIPVDLKQSTIQVRIEIEGVPTWSYTYYEDDIFRNNTIVQRPKRHDLGQPYDLKTELHQWEFRLTNPSDNNTRVSIRMKWVQFQHETLSERRIAEWSIKDHNLDANSSELFTDEGFIIKN